MAKQHIKYDNTYDITMYSDTKTTQSVIETTSDKQAIRKLWYNEWNQLLKDNADNVKCLNLSVPVLNANNRVKSLDILNVLVLDENIQADNFTLEIYQGNTITKQVPIDNKTNSYIQAVNEFIYQYESYVASYESFNKATGALHTFTITLKADEQVVCRATFHNYA